MSRGHLSKHPSAFDIAGSSISISPVMQNYSHNRPMMAQVPASPASLLLSSDEEDDGDDDDDDDDANNQHQFSTFGMPDYGRTANHYRNLNANSNSGLNRNTNTSTDLQDPLSMAPPFPTYRAGRNSNNSAYPQWNRMDRTRRKSTPSKQVGKEAIAAVQSPMPSSSQQEHEQFLEERRAAAVVHYLATDDKDMEALYKRRVQVEYAIGRAKERVAQLSLKSPSKKHHKKGCMANIMRRIQILKDNPFWSLWGEELKEIEGNFGSAVVLTFAFLRWVFLLNVGLSILWISAIVIPFFLSPPSSFQWTGIKQYFQANGLEKTWILLGGYFYKSEQTGWYRADYMYPCTIAAMYLTSLIAILAKIAKRIMGSGDSALVYTPDTFPYATVVFTAWDFRISSLEAATKLRRGIRMQLREMLADSMLIVKTPKATNNYEYYKRYAVLGLLWPMVMAGTITGVYYLVSKSDLINTKLKTAYAQPALMTILVSIIGPFLVRILVKLEDWKPSTAEKVVIIKLFFLRATNLTTFLYRLYVLLHNGYLSTQGLLSDPCLANSKCSHEGFLCCNTASDGEWSTCLRQPIGYCASKCMENEVGKQILKLIITSTVINCILDIGMGLIFKFLLNEEQELSIPDFAIDVVYIQVLVWTGSHFSPLASTTGVLCFLLTFYSKKITLKTCTSTQKLYSASRTSVMTYGVLLVALVLCIFPEAVFVTSQSSGICGPIGEGQSMYDTVANYIGRAGYPLSAVLEWLGSPVILGAIIILLVFGVVLQRAKLVQSNQVLEMRIKEHALDHVIVPSASRRHPHDGGNEAFDFGQTGR
ncbi:hypothetical protein KP509_16G079800 [Ceratopteris richardii]|uniref:TMC domain-containing protein n=1 Tax=Ceratopteris richardii TaxID=49495 RepID=A0A8T2T1V8_CERRI|nr:hypothetical protein KP509_16G079800 [Ceratopteris richardii]KAH7388523.1 hypothetical protein KP509_16G079800 [Ceratopteris richardii]